MIELKNITKIYNGIAVVNSVSFNLAPGQITGYLGPNGAGKSTTVKMMTGLIKPDKGTILYNGRDISDNITEFKKLVGYIPEQSELYNYLTGREFLEFTGRLRGIEEEVLNRRTDTLMEEFGMSIDSHLPIANYSKGMRQKILIASALLHNPEILIFDEPLSGLDITTTMVVKDILKGLAEKGRIIIYSSHILEVVERICSRVIILNRGEIAADDSVANLKQLRNTSSLEHIFRNLVEVADTSAKSRTILSAIGS